MTGKHLAMGGAFVIFLALLLQLHNPFYDIDPWIFAHLPFVIFPFGAIAFLTGILFMRIEQESTSAD
ncbi:MAG: hypothetical protein ACFFEF_14555 [Candidatus Thorarchaeota archaeon]